eukprot:218839-Chlamydomonas_euryale.AAC.18
MTDRTDPTPLPCRLRAPPYSPTGVSLVSRRAAARDSPECTAELTAAARFSSSIETHQQGQIAAEANATRRALGPLSQGDSVSPQPFARAA